MWIILLQLIPALLEIRAKTFQWSYTNPSLKTTAAPGDVILKEGGTPWGVNLATVLQAISGPDISYFNEHRLKELKDDQATITVQDHSNPRNTVDKTVRFADVPGTYCNPERGVWPGVVVSALGQAGWDVADPMNISTALYAITGIEVLNIFKSDDTSITAENFYTEVFKKTLWTSRLPVVLETDATRTNGRLKKNFAYSVYVAQDYETLTLTDVAGDGQIRINATDVYENALNVWTLKEPTSVAGQ